MSSLHLPEDRLIVALDGMDRAEALSFLAKAPEIRWVKVGLELFVSAGPEIVAELRTRGLRVFLDLKFHDIPATMAGVCRQAARTGAELITVHASAGRQALIEARNASKEGAEEVGLKAPTLLAVTVLTSWDKKRFAEELLIPQDIYSRVKWLSQLAKDVGIGGCVCSPMEVHALRELHPEPFELVTPGIRRKGSNCGDQERVMSALETLKAGASRLVIGRPITQAKDRVESFSSFCREIAELQRD